MADIGTIKGNIRSMIDQGAPEADIDMYISSMGVSLSDLQEDRSILSDLTHPETVRTTLEMGGMAVGGTVGAGAGPVGALAGGGLGFAAGSKLADIYEELMGHKEPAPLGSQLVESGKDVVEGATYEAGGQVVGPILKGAKNVAKWPFKKAALTKEGAMEKASKIFIAQSKGTAQTQAQIDRNIVNAQLLEKRIPNLKFTQGQLTNDASAITLERSLSRKSGTDLAQSQREFANKALRDYYSKQVAGTGDPTQVIARAQRMADDLRAATKVAEDSVNAEVMRLSRHMDSQTTGKTIFETLSKVVTVGSNNR